MSTSNVEIEDLYALIIRNLGDLETAAYQLYHEIDLPVIGVINELVESWAKENKWTGGFDFDDDDLWVAPAEWKSGESYLCRFWLGGNGDDDFEWLPNEDMFFLTRLCQKGRGLLGWRWWYSDGLGVTKSKWKKFIGENSQYIERLQKRGFVYEESGLFFTKFFVEAEDVAVAIKAGTIKSAIKEPLYKVLNQLLAAKDDFDTMLEVAKKKFK